MTEAGGFQFASLLLPLGVFVVMYFILIRPQQKRSKEITEMRNNIKKGDNIITIGGINGKITNIKDDIVTIEIGADKTKLDVAKWSIGSVVSKDKK